MGGRAIMPDVVEYLARQPGNPITLQQLAAGTGIDAGRIQKALSNAIGSGVYGDALECVHRGRVWQWRGNGTAAQALAQTAEPPPTIPHGLTTVPAPVAPPGLKRGDMVEVMGLTQDGDAVARDEDGRLFRVTPL